MVPPAFKVDLRQHIVDIKLEYATTVDERCMIHAWIVSCLDRDLTPSNGVLAECELSWLGVDDACDVFVGNMHYDIALATRCAIARLCKNGNYRARADGRLQRHNWISH